MSNKSGTLWVTSQTLHKYVVFCVIFSLFLEPTFQTFHAAVWLFDLMCTVKSWSCIYSIVIYII